MGIFDKLFGRKGDSKHTSSDQSKKQNLFLTNAGEFGLGKIELGISGKIRVDGILAIAALQKEADARGASFEYHVMYTTLLEEGALTVPVVVKIGEKKYSLYFIYNEEDLLKYKDLQTHVRKTEYPDLIHFSSIPIYDGYKPKPIVEPFQLADLRHDKDAKIEGEYGMWWQTDNESVFHNSKTFEYLNKLYDVFNGYETYLYGYVLRQTRIVEDAALQRFKLPEKHSCYIVNAPENKKVVLDVSLEKGIRFLFPISQVTKEYRERFLRGALVDFLATRISLQQSNVPLDEKTDPNSYDWFTFMSRMVKQKEQGGDNINIIGGFNLKG